uniref:LRRNT domain-containing protein n=1 Tax=Salarias fasciatus TaxID=181472 RepID=A0A672FX63_SALFA
MNVRSAALLFLFLLQLPLPPARSECPPRCLCYEHGDMVDCRGGGFRNVPRGLPLEKLDLSWNHLASAGPGLFRGLSRLRMLFLHNNRLTAVQQGSLDMLPGLEVDTH